MTTPRYTSALVVIPTRNRSDMAQNASRSVLCQPARNVNVLISDNSTVPEEAESLARYCERLGDDRLHYVRPPKPLPMAQHWDWAMRHALQTFGASHVIYLTDRMMFKRGELQNVLDIAKTYPDKVITYYHDWIVDNDKPITIEQTPWTGKLFEVDCRRLSYQYSKIHLHLCLPRMLNSLVPRDALDAVCARFGNMFGSISPDFNFGFRCLELFDSFIYYDKSPIFHYGQVRSNGASMARGERTSDHADFLAHCDARLNDALPVPEMWTVGNAILHEYCVVKQQTSSARFYELDRSRYLQYLSKEVEHIVNPALRAEMRTRLAAHGTVSDEVRRSSRTVSQTMRKLLSPAAVLNKIGWTIRNIRWTMRNATRSAATKHVWLFLARYFGMRLPADHRFQFDSVEEAIDFMQNFPRGSAKEWPWQHELLRPREDYPRFG